MHTKEFDSYRCALVRFENHTFDFRPNLHDTKCNCHVHFTWLCPLLAPEHGTRVLTPEVLTPKFGPSACVRVRKRRRPCMVLGYMD